MTSTESPTVSPGSREADTATPVTATHARDDFDILSPQQISARLDLKVQVYARRRQVPADSYQPRHEARRWGVRHGGECLADAAVLPCDDRVEADFLAGEWRKRPCPSASLVSRVLPDGEWEAVS